MGDYIKVLGKVKIHNIHKSPLTHRAIHHTLVTGATEIISFVKINLYLQQLVYFAFK